MIQEYNNKPIYKAYFGENSVVLNVGGGEILPDTPPIEGDTSPILETLFVNKNGVYTPDEGVDGFDLVNVNILTLLEDKNISITSNGTQTITPSTGFDGIGSVNIDVNVTDGTPKINLQQTGIKLAYSTITEIPEWVDWEGITNMKNMFYGCSYIYSIPLIDTSKVTDMRYMFTLCESLETIPQLDTSNVINMCYMFSNCSKLTSIPPIDTSNVGDVGYMFYQCTSLESLPLLDFSSVTDIDNFFYQNITRLTELGGFRNLKISWNDFDGLLKCPNLTYQSCINVLNELYDFTGHNEIPTSSQGILRVHQNFLDLVGDEISIGTNKGWTIIS